MNRSQIVETLRLLYFVVESIIAVGIFSVTIMLNVTWRKKIFAAEEISCGMCSLFRFSLRADTSSTSIEWTEWYHCLRLLQAEELPQLTLLSQFKPCPATSLSSEMPSSLKSMSQESLFLTEKSCKASTGILRNGGRLTKPCGRKEKLCRSWPSSKLSKLGGRSGDCPKTLWPSSGLGCSKTSFIRKHYNCLTLPCFFFFFFHI